MAFDTILTGVIDAVESIAAVQKLISLFLHELDCLNIYIVIIHSTKIYVSTLQPGFGVSSGLPVGLFLSRHRARYAVSQSPKFLSLNLPPSWVTNHSIVVWSLTWARMSRTCPTTIISTSTLMTFLNIHESALDCSNLIAAMSPQNFTFQHRPARTSP